MSKEKTIELLRNRLEQYREMHLSLVGKLDVQFAIRALQNEIEFYKAEIEEAENSQLHRASWDD